MKLPSIKKAVESYSIDELKVAENALYEELPLQIEIEGADEGEKLTHILAAIAIKEDMAAGKDYTTAVRDYSKRVRTSIS